MFDYEIEVKCPCCGSKMTINVNHADYRMWSCGDLLTQDAFPYLTAATREQLISGICELCWEDIFGAEDEDEEEE